MNYRDYTARIEFDEASETFHGRIEGIRDIITFEGSSVGELKNNLVRECVLRELGATAPAPRAPRRRPAAG